MQICLFCAWCEARFCNLSVREWQLTRRVTRRFPDRGSIGSLSNDDGDVNENGKKAIGLDWKTTTLLVHHALLYISLPSLQDYNVKIPNFTFCGGRKHKTTTFFFFSRTLIQSLRIQLRKKIANIWRTERDGISAIKLEGALLHFLSDVFLAVVVVVA